MSYQIQSIYDEIHRVIRPLNKQVAIDILEEVSSHCDAMAEALQQELDEEEDDE